MDSVNEAVATRAAEGGCPVQHAAAAFGQSRQERHAEESSRALTMLKRMFSLALQGRQSCGRNVAAWSCIYLVKSNTAVATSHTASSGPKPSLLNRTVATPLPVSVSTTLGLNGPSG
jgi:hypothetical protein